MRYLQKYKNWIIVVSIIFGMTVFYYLFIQDSSSVIETNNQGEIDPLTIAEEETTKSDPTEKIKEPTVVVVDVKGAIKHPGVYELPTGTRVHHLIDKAGGMIKEADELAVNLAAPLEDGMVLYVPKKGEVKENQLTAPINSSDINDKVNINLATSEELQTLTGIGPAKAEAIITYREENGLFTAPEDLLNVSGIGEKSFEKLKEEITVK
ncbi:helix-hairpin-helix domain-containing protein [uncultured Metabacillus sp.]|uniref:helix-hairpin-helix domain-containing protein n=1 Tax=Metabacillus sp. Hm71 TaxID=3450743 RepID=UPI00260EB535|nr:helix-hairpin-helix domain-containing protein [uncultured Metabacillus sp.]